VLRIDLTRAKSSRLPLTAGASQLVGGSSEDRPSPSDEMGLAAGSDASRASWEYLSSGGSDSDFAGGSPTGDPCDTNDTEMGRFLGTGSCIVSFCERILSGLD
jgi:hypothetical protein